MPGEFLGIKRGRGNDELELRALREQVVQIAQKKVDIEAALMGLIDDDEVVSFKLGVGLGLGKQHAIGKQLNGHARPRLVVEPNLVADPRAWHTSALRPDFLGNTASH